MIGTFVSNIGNGMFSLIVSKVLYDKTGSVTAFGIVIIVQNIASLLLNIVAGYSADRFSTRRVSMIADFLQGLLILSGAILLRFGDQIIVLMTVMVLVNFVLPFFRAANFKIIPELNRGETKLISLNGFRSSLNQSGQLIGVALAAPLIFMHWTIAALVINATSFFISCFCTSRLKLKQANTPTKLGKVGNLYRSWVDIIRTLFLDKQLLLLLIFTIFDYISVSFVNLMEIKYATVTLHNAALLSLLDGAFAVGAMSAFLLINIWFSRVRFHTIAWVGLLIQGLMFIALCIFNDLVIAAIVMFIIGVFNGCSVSIFQTELHKIFKDNDRGRISSFRDVLVSIGTIIVIPVASRALNLDLNFGLIVFGVFLIVIAVFLVVVCIKGLFSVNIEDDKH
ncbi:hypothetical protein FC83_GL001950 [Agrilactobacillus composti DSM 18527 = JCM 14202]|uniref:Major facilitator superfamily (MFS) profile domain-containing protein n=2 Tax=Agrilactobacillus TaxID=2767875 RepID=A0A0R1XYJ9_9LACO|nr:hypothetical protein FC83_GL001950 [Agrilactobacillus composti DSM 18527 = JCM 14202]